ncbi:MAG: TPM domain-containing protein, partial [Spirochaetota bacterium]
MRTLSVRIIYTAVLVFCLAAGTRQLEAREIPALTGRINDYAQIISTETERRIEKKLAALEATDSTQIVVLTIDSLEGDVLEEFSIRVAEQWKIGREKEDNGAILIVSRDDRKIRIEVGYGLEGVLTDLLSGRIIDTVIVPEFRNGDYDAGIEKGVDTMIAAVKGEYVYTPVEKQDSGHGSNFVFVIVALIFLALFFISVFGRKKLLHGGFIGAIFFPVIGALALSFGWFLLAFIPAGFFIGLVLAAQAMAGGRGGSSGG